MSEADGIPGDELDRSDRALDKMHAWDLAHPVEAAARNARELAFLREWAATRESKSDGSP